MSFTVYYPIAWLVWCHVYMLCAIEQMAWAPYDKVAAENQELKDT